MKEETRRQLRIRRDAERKRRNRCFDCSKPQMIVTIVMIGIICFMLGLQIGMNVEAAQESVLLQQEIDSIY